MIIIGFCDGKADKVIHLDTPFDFSKIECVAPKEEPTIDTVLNSLIQIIDEIFSDENKSQKKCGKNQGCSSECASRKIKVNSCKTKSSDSVVKKLTEQIANEISIDSRNISKKVKRFNLKFGDRIKRPEKRGDGYTATEATWSDFYKFCSKN